MGRNTAEKILLTLLLIAVIFFGLMIVDALDRNRRELLRISEKLAERPAPLPATVPPAPNGSPGAVAATPSAAGNAQFFDPRAIAGGRLVTAIGSDVGSLNPITGNDNTAAMLIGACSATLATRDWAQPEKFVPMIAESWEVAPDHRTYRIKLRRGVLWQDFTDPDTGKVYRNVEVTAADFVFYLDVVRNEGVNAAHLRSYYQALEYIRAVNDYELELRWRDQYYRALELTLGLPPLARRFYLPDGGKFDPAKFNDDHRRNRMIVGCGPYRLAGWEKDQRIVLKRFENYFGKNLGIMPPLETLVFEVVKTPNTRIQMLLSGQLDLLNLLPEQWTRRASAPPFSRSVLVPGGDAAAQKLVAGETIRRAKYLSQSYFYIGYNLRNPLFQDKRVRRALTMLVNRERIVRDVYFGLAKVISGPFFYDSPYYDRAIAPWPFDPARAIKLLAEAGWRDTDGDGILDCNGKKFIFTAMQVASNPLQEKILTIAKEDFAKAGIEMKIAVFEWPVYLQRLESRSYEVCSLGWAMPYESDPYQVWHSSQADTPAGSNHVSFKNPEADRLIETIRKTFDLNERIRLCHQFHALLHDEQPYTFLVVPDSLNAISAAYRNVRIFPLGFNSECWWLQPRAE